MEKNNNKFKKSLVLLGMSTSLTLNGCQQTNETEKCSIEKVAEHIVDESGIDYIELENIMKYRIIDLYVNNSPTKNGTVTQRIFFKAAEKIENGKKYLYFVYPDINYAGDWICEEDIIDCEKEWWIPDYNIPTITPLSNYLNIKNTYLDRDSLTLKEIYDLQNELNNTNPTYENDKYSIESLILVNAEGHYSLYSTEKQLVYGTVSDGNLLFYFFDIIDYKNALKVELNVGIDDFQKILFGENGNVKNYEISSLDANYARSLNDKDKKIILGVGERCKIKGISADAIIFPFSEYITLEQEQRGYLTQDEAEEIINDLNLHQKSLNLKRN